MTVPSTRPRVFLSSTIYDFVDLRSALKFWLEELGYEVNASEYNDFRKHLDLNSYEACLDTIDKCDYFILLIGSRSGGWFDESTKTTITMHEYRRAYDRARTGQVKILAFVRQSVWDVREDRKGIKSILEDEAARDIGVTSEIVQLTQRHKSRVVMDAETVFLFLNEVARNTEMVAAAKSGGDLPPCNWIHQFSSFRDVVDALRSNFVGSHGVRRAALNANLRTEIVENLRHLLSRSKEGCSPLYSWAAHARRAFSEGPFDDSRIQGHHLLWLSMFALFASVHWRLHTQALQQAINSGEFLVFNRDSDRYEVGDIQAAMLELLGEIGRLKREEAALDPNERSSMIVRYKNLSGVKEVQVVPNQDILSVMSLHDRYFNVTTLSKALVRALEGGKFRLPTLQAGTPFQSEAIGIEAETPRVSDIHRWIASEDP